MATLAKNGTGSYRASGIVARDARHTHNGPNEPAHRATKDKKRWCRGKKGVPHKLVVKLIVGFLPRLVRHCSECGKEFGRHYHGVWSKAPAWASPEDLKALERAKQGPKPEIRRR